MHKRISMRIGAITAALLSGLLLQVCSAAEKPELHAFMSIALQGAMAKLLPEYEKQSGQRVVPTFSSSASLNQRLHDGADTDLLISSRGGIDSLTAEGKIVAGSAVAIGSSGVGVAVRKGAPRPDISTPEAFKRTLLAARAISYTNPAGGGASGVQVAKVLEKLGIAEQINAKAKFPPPNGRTASLLVNGEVDLAIQQTPELLAVPEAEVIGQLPGDLQSILEYVAGIPTSAKQGDEAEKFVRFLQTKNARAALQQEGIAAPTGQ